MKLIDQNQGIKRLSKLRKTFRRQKSKTEFEPAAKDCLTCEVQGSCCTDAHFVNVQISRLEAVAMRRALDDLDRETLEMVATRNAEAVKKPELRMTGETYSCPLFEKGTGCLVHKTAKPLPCINHACYEKQRRSAA